MPASEKQTKESATLDASLAKELDNKEAIQAIKDLYDVDDKTARELWAGFIMTVAKMKHKIQGVKQAE